MTSFAKLDEAFNHSNHGLATAASAYKKKSSHSSSSSLRMKRGKSDSPESSCSSTPSYRLKATELNNNNVVQNTGYYQNCQMPTNDYGGYNKPSHDYGAYNNDDEVDDGYCLSLINQVLQNKWCKKILRNILLEEYMDGFLKEKMDAVNGAPVRRVVVDNKSEVTSYPAQSGGADPDKIWGLDLRTLTILGLGALIAIYLYDLYNRLFR